MEIRAADGPLPESLVSEHVALPRQRPGDRAWVRLNMISSVDGATAIAGVSGGLGNRDDHAVFAALRAHADAIVVGMSTVVAEQYRLPSPDGVEVFVCATTPDVSGAPDLFASDRVVLVIPEDAPTAPDGVRVVRAGHGRVDLGALMRQLAGRVVVSEGGPRLAGAFVAHGLIDELFVTIAPRVVAGASPRIAHGTDDADPTSWSLVHGIVDDEGFLFLRYARH